MKKIKIFIAGSKDLVNERDSIKILANDLNSVYNAKDTIIIIHSYEHFNDRQDDYNEFIGKEADLVIFILDGSIGSKTEEEFMKATDSLNKANRPEVMVFLRDFKEVSPSIARIQGLIVGRLGDRYYINYSNCDDLKAKARERIIRYIDKNDIAPAKSSVVREHIIKKPGALHRNVKVLLFSLCFIIALLGTLLWCMQKPSELLIFAGGGSVKNFIEATRGIDIVDYPHSVYANLATGSAWALLTEEASRYQEDGGKGQTHFSSICLSADDIDSTFINEKTKGMFVNARIIRYNLGKDPLVVYIHNKVLTDKQIPQESTSISVDSLRSLIKYALTNKEKIRIFTTSKTSGTLRLYQSCFVPEDDIDLEKLLDSKMSYLFYKKSTSAYVNALDFPNGNLPYIILGSQFYYPLTLDTETEKQYHTLFVKKGDINIFKPMNIYFIGKYNAENADYCTINAPIIQFLKDIHAENDLNEDTWHELLKGKKKTEGGNLILNLN